MSKLPRNFIWLLVGSVISKFLGFLTTVWLARILGVDGFGKISFALACFAYASLITDLGLCTIGTREVAKDKRRIKEYLSAIISLRLLLSLISFALVLLLAFSIPTEESTRFLIIFYGFSLFLIPFILDWLFRGIEDMRYIAIADVLRYGIYFLLSVSLVKNSGDILKLPFIWLIANLLSAILYTHISARFFGRTKMEFNFPLFKTLLHSSIPVGFAAIMLQIYYNFDIICLNFMKGDEVVGWYNAGYKLIFFVLILDRIFCIIILPIISRHYKQSLEKLRFTLSRSQKLIVEFALPLGIGGTLLGKPIMNFIYGAKYLNGVIGFQILIWACVLSFITSIYGFGLIGCDRERRYALGVMVGTICNLCLNFILIPQFSLTGAAIATVAAEGVMFAIMYFEFRKVINVPFLPYIPKSLLSSILMGCVIYNLKNINVIIVILIGAAVYTLSLYLLRGITEEDISFIKKLIWKK